MNCAGCGHENPERARFCLECGRAFAPVCGSCGTELPAGAEDLLQALELLSAGFDGGAVALDAADAPKARFKLNKKGTKAKLKLKQKVLEPMEGRKGSYSAGAKGAP